MNVQFLKGIGPSAAKGLAKLGIETVDDLLHYLPYRYEDRSNFRQIASVWPGEFASLKGRILSVDSRNRHGTFTIVRAAIGDASGSIGLIWFNQRWIKTALDKHGGEIVVYGQVKEGNYGNEIANPEWEPIEKTDDPSDFARITPIYRLTEGVYQKLLRKAVRAALASVDEGKYPDIMPPDIAREYRLKPLAWSLRQAHFPDSEEGRVAARRRLVFEEFFYMQLALAVRRERTGAEPGITFLAGREVEEEIHAALQFDFTDAQKRVIREIFADMRRPHPMNRLLQGDVGSGKTAVAAAAMLAAVRTGYQGALMAPTEILAEQHYVNLHRLFESMGISVALLVGKQTAKQKRDALERAQNGQAQISVGTHALIQEGVEFAKLGLVVIDEQHRFGVMQRGALRQKGHGNPDVLVMTATPIPRTLTLTAYGELDLSVIDEMPPGRKPIRTHWKLPSDRTTVYETIRNLVRDGAQAYIVCPLVSESEKMLAQAANELYLRMSQMIFPELRVGLLHGQMKTKEKEEAMEKFRRQELDVLVSTTVIEVGVDVANASIMVIEDANRFGLAQLHQLRGRVGRGERQSYCILIGAANNPDAEARLRVMEETTDGFRISEEDLKIRGPGELYGTKQSGELELRVADLLRDGKILEEARQAAIELVADDPKLAKPPHLPLRDPVRAVSKRVIRTDVS